MRKIQLKDAKSKLSAVVDQGDHRAKRQRCGERVLSGECIGGRRKDLVVVAIELRRPPGHKARGSIQGGPGHQGRQRLKQTVVALRVIERPLFGLDVFEVGKALHISAQMLRAERALEA